MSAILGMVAWPMLGGRIYPGDDLANFHLPLRSFYAGCLAAGDRFDWCPKLFCGFYLQGEGQVGMYHPLHLLLYGWLPLTAAFNLELLASYALMFPGMFLLLRRRQLPRDAALFGAMAFTLSGFNLLHYMHLNFLMVIAHLPWLLLAIDALDREARAGRRARLVAAIALLTASQILASYPQAVYFSCVAEAIYALWSVAPARDLRRLLPMVEGKVLGALLGALQLVPTWDAVTHSLRAAPSASFLASGSLHPVNLVQLIAPYLFRDRFFTDQPPDSVATHELGMYAGAMFPPLLAWLAIRWKAQGAPRPLAIGALVSGSVALLLASGVHGPLFELTARLPLIGLFRNPGRAIVLLHLSTAMLSAVALADLYRHEARVPWRRLWPLGVVPALSLFVGVGSALLARARPGFALAPFLAPIDRVLAGPLLIGVATAAVVAAARRVRPATVAILAFAAADQALYGLSYIERDPPISIAELLGTWPLPPEAVGGRVKAGGDNLWIMKGVDLVQGYVGLTPARRLNYAYRDCLRVAGVRWIRADTPDGTWEPLPDSPPRARLVTRAVRGPLFAQDCARAASASERLAFTSDSLSLPGGEPGVAVITRDRPGAIRVATDAPARQLLVLNESYHDDWRVRVDGRPGRILRVNDDFLGSVVERGGHVVEFRFEPRSLRLGAWLSAAGAALLTARSLWAHRPPGILRRLPLTLTLPSPSPEPAAEGEGVGERETRGSPLTPAAP